MGTSHRSGVLRRSNETARLLVTTIMGMVLGYFIGVSFPSIYLSKINLPSSLMTSLDMAFTDDPHSSTSRSFPENLSSGNTPLSPKGLWLQLRASPPLDSLHPSHSLLLLLCSRVNKLQRERWLCSLLGSTLADSRLRRQEFAEVQQPTPSPHRWAARQLEFFKGRYGTGPSTDTLADALAIAQYHDAVSGTQRQHVAADYALRLSIGYKEAEKVVASSLAALTSSRSKSMQMDSNPEFQQVEVVLGCHLEMMPQRYDLEKGIDRRKSRTTILVPTFGVLLDLFNSNSSFWLFFCYGDFFELLEFGDIVMNDCIRITFFIYNISN